ncbi:MAG: exosortase U [Planctomycetales bacterium]|nr:exosortase U [Planctomycetales bacterium]
MSTIDTRPSAKSAEGLRTPLMILAACAVVGYVPLLFVHFKDLWGNEQYQYFPFVIGAVIALVATRWKTGFTVERSGLPEWLPRVFVVTAAIVLVSAVVFWSGWLAAISLILLLGSLLCLCGQERWITNFWGIWLLLWLLIPLPLSLGPKLIRSLQAASSQLSSAMLDVLGIRHLMTGNVLEVPTKQFFVDEACSGIVSFMAIIAAGAIYLVWKNRPLVHSVLLLLLGVGWAFLLNVSRITIIAFAYERYDWDWSEGTPHTILGLVLFTLTFVALVSTDVLLEFLLKPVEVQQFAGDAKVNVLIRMFNGIAGFATPYGAVLTDDDQPQAKPAPSNAPAIPDIGVSGKTWALAGLFATLGIVQIALMLLATDPNAQVVEHAMKIGKKSVPLAVGPWEFVGHEYVSRDVGNEELSDHSHVFTYKHSQTQLPITISLDFAYTGGWHDLCICYTGAGWEVGERQTKQHGDFKYIETNMDNEMSQHAFLAFGAFDATGSYVTPPSSLIRWRPWSALRRRTLRTISPRLLQVQVFVAGNEQVSAEDKETIRQLFYDCVEVFRSHFEKPRS